METELLKTLSGRRRRAWEGLMDQAGLRPSEPLDEVLLLWDGTCLASAGARRGNVLQCIAVDPRYQGQDAAATVLTQLRQSAFSQGIEKLFLYTKPKNQPVFQSLFFYPVAATGDAALMESERDGIRRFLAGLSAPCRSGVIGAAVMNCNPFTLGHRYLIERAAAECDWVYVFVLSEEQGLFPAADRLRLAREGTADLQNVTVHPSGPYQISSATFPDYFLADRSRTEEIHCRLDLQIFLDYYAEAFHISRRYVGTEPLSPLTMAYNREMAAFLPPRGVAVQEISRRERDGAPISASTVRRLLGQNRPEALSSLVPPTTLRYLAERNLISSAEQEDHL